MNKENASKLWKIIQEAGDYLKDQLPEHPNHPKGRNPYAHVAICVKSKFQKSYKDIEDEKFKEDPLGWFQWYCRFKMGRRIPHIDRIQIKRWKAFGDRHIPAIKKNCDEGDMQCRRRQRQAVLQWAYDPFI